ncbi:MAG TPA: glucose 1-dehydrogenase [Jatrophihabitans sp.]|jgi:NAD(P)-dependent dehydrogenase (short-subunit alcohol dehydrogenase family)
MVDLEGRVAIVTGAATGIGAACAQRLARDGARVVVADLNDRDGATTVEKIERDGGVATLVRVDISDESSVAELIERTVRTYGRLDILHNNAAALGDDGQRGDIAIADGQVEIWDRTFAVNLRGVMLGCKHAIPMMIEGGGGVIVNTSSTSALSGGPSSVAYAASKSGIMSVTQHVAARYGRNRIRCVAVAPGLIVTDHVAQNVNPRWRDIMTRQLCLPDVGRPEDVASTVAFLVSDEARYITGILVPVDGGQTCHRASFFDELDEILGTAAR